MLETINWNLEFQQAYKNLNDLYQFLGWDDFSLEEVAKTYPLFVPRRLATKIKNQGPHGVLAREFLPHKNELNDFGFIDPIGDKKFNKAPQLIHRYPSRALFTPTNVCPVHCRYCFRKNELNPQNELFQAEFESTLSYLKAHPEISEIIFTGGDPFTLSTGKLQRFLDGFAGLGSIKDIRFHTRYAVIMPERFDDDLLRLLKDISKKFRTVSIAVHANHVCEFDELAIKTINRINKLPLQLLSQTVLLKEVNDNSQDLLDLINFFLDLKIRPYYLHHPDRVKGGMHFYIPLEEGRKIYASLRNSLPGWALPQYIIDIPGGEGKISAFNPESFEYSGQLLTREGFVKTLPEPDFFTH